MNKLIYIISKKKDESLSVQEDNYTKYFLNSDQSNQEEDDHEFETFDNEDTTNDNYDAESVASDNETTQADKDTGKNNHFFVWTSKSMTAFKNKLLRQQDDAASDNDSDEHGSVYSDTTSDDNGLYSEDDHEEEHEDHKSILKAAVSSESLKSSHQNEEDSEIFFNETTEILIRGFKENLKLENVVLEINSCKHAHDIQIDDLCYYLVRTMFNLPLVFPTKEISAGFDYLTSVKSQIQKSFSYLFKNYFTKTKQSQKIFLNAFLDFFVEAKPVNSVSLLDTVYLKLMHYLYTDDKVGFLNDEVILDWYDSKLKDQKLSDRHKIGLKKLENFIKWLEEEDEDEDDEEE